MTKVLHVLTTFCVPASSLALLRQHIFQRFHHGFIASSSLSSSPSLTSRVNSYS